LRASAYDVELLLDPTGVVIFNNAEDFKRTDAGVYVYYDAPTSVQNFINFLAPSFAMELLFYTEET